MTVAFIGHGYVGLVTAAVFADLGNTVWVVGRTKEKIENLKRGSIPFFEPGLAELVQRNIEGGRLIFTLDYNAAVAPSQIIFICVGTPSKPSGEADCTQVLNAALEIGKHIRGYKIIAIKSTVPPGTNKEAKTIIDSVKPAGLSFDMASVPEFLREGTAIEDTVHPDRVVIGTSSLRAQKILTELHKPINGKYVICNEETAELIKYASNAMLSTKISFANAIACISEKVGADVEKVLEGVGFDRRIGRSFLSPGVGFGGSCFPKDVRALISIAHQHGYDFQLLKAVEDVNSDAKKNFIDKILKHFHGNIKGKVIGILGLSFKPNTDDMREAPSIAIIATLYKHGASIAVYDPAAEENAKKLLPKAVRYASSAYGAAKGADAVCIITEWNEFRQLDLLRLAKELKTPVVFDGRNIYEPRQMAEIGYTYYSVGRI